MKINSAKHDLQRQIKPCIAPGLSAVVDEAWGKEMIILFHTTRNDGLNINGNQSPILIVGSAFADRERLFMPFSTGYTRGYA